MKIFRDSKGETLAETIIALSILAIGITIASTIILNSMRNLTNAKNRIIAVNIAREGIEAMRSIRDSNWLYYSDRRRQCWNHNPGAGFCDGTGTNLIPPGVFMIYKKNDHSWQLILADSQPFIDTDGDGITANDVDPNRIRLSLVDIDNLVDSDSDGDPANDLDMYNHKDAAATDSLGTEIKTTPFRRYIKIEYLENAPAAPEDSIDNLSEWTAANKTLLNRMRITSIVEWSVRGTHTAELTTIITDHLGRENLSS